MEQQEEKWDQLANQYNDTVYSLTRSPEKRNRIIALTQDGQRVLIVGCGSQTYLQEDLLKEKNIQLIASDFNRKMLEVSRKNFSHPNLEHKKADTKNLPFEEGIFDIVVSTNSIIPENRVDVVEMYRSINSILKPGGKFVAYLPSFTCAEEIREALPELDIQTDKKQLRCFDTTGWQCFHTKDSIRSELLTAGFLNPYIEQVSGAENNEELEQLTKIYSQRAAELLWEFFVVAQK